MTHPNPVTPHSLRSIWSAVFLGNLPVPLLASFSVTDWPARIGMLTAIGTLYIWGLEGCRRMRALRSLFIPSGTIIALLQMCPALQLVAGGWAIDVGRSLGLANEFAVAGVLDGYIVTLVTGSMLLASAVAAVLVGRALVAIGKLMPERERHRRPKRLRLYHGGRVFLGHEEIEDPVTEA
jgi:hypothetical protein